jgi:hypothetical protein
MSVVRRAFSTPERNQKQSNPSDNSRKEFWKIVGVGVAGALCGVADSPQNQPSWKGAMHGAGSALSSWAEKRSEEFDNEEIYYDHKVALSTQNEEFAYLSSSRSLADAHSESYSNVNLQQSLTVGEKTVLAANDLRKSGYYASSRFNDVVETALTGHPNERVRAIKKVGADLEYYKGY